MSELPYCQTLLLDVENQWLRIWLNRPESRNALSEELVSELRQVLEAVREDRSIRGITLRGCGGVFCAGGDLKAFKRVFQSESGNHQAAIDSNRGGGELFNLINTMPQVVLMLVEGAAMAGGLGMLCAADIVAVTRDAKFSLTETTLGIPPAQIAPFVVNRLGLPTARRLMLTAARFDGNEAGRLGLANYVVDDAAELEIIEQQTRGSVQKCAPGANAATKRILIATSQLEGDSLIDFAAEQFADAMLSAEGREGLSAFAEKRKPSWAIQQDSGKSEL